MDSATGIGRTALAGVNAAYVILLLLLLLLWPMITLMSSSRLPVGPVGYRYSHRFLRRCASPTIRAHHDNNIVGFFFN